MSDFKIVKLLGNPVQLIFTGGINPRGEWDIGTNYSTGDSVSYNGSSYVAIQATLGDTPPNITYWQILATGFSIMTETFVGSSCTGTPGDSGRTIDVTGTPFIVALEKTILTNNVDYNFVLPTITFNIDVWDEQRITLWRNG